MWKSRHQNLLFQVCCCYVLGTVISLVLFHSDFVKTVFITLCGQCSLSSITLVVILCFTEISLSDWSPDRKGRGKESKLHSQYLQIGSEFWQLIKLRSWGQRSLPSISTPWGSRWLITASHPSRDIQALLCLWLDLPKWPTYYNINVWWILGSRLNIYRCKYLFIFAICPLLEKVLGNILRESLYIIFP